MSSFEFEPATKPFPRWWGPFSPARGVRTGFRIHRGELGVWVSRMDCQEFWSVIDSNGGRNITRTVRAQWGGGRVLLLPNGFVMKPLQQDYEIGQRVFIGQFRGSIVLKSPDGTRFDMGNPGSLRPGQIWPGPTTTGLECVILSSGALKCTWYHPTDVGRDEVHQILRGPDRGLSDGYWNAQHGRKRSGRVRITANGHVITHRKEGNEIWIPMYVGSISSQDWGDWTNWIGKECT